MKKNVLFLVATLVTATSCTHAYKITSSFMDKFDGSALGVDGEKIKIVKKIELEIARMLFGRMAGGKRVGLYTYKGDLCTVEDLVVIEQDLAQAEPSAQVEQDKKELHELFVTVRTNFQKMVSPFINQARIIKQMTCKLITKSCKLRNRLDSALLDWAAIDNEVDAIDKMESFAEFRIFAYDLLNFFTDMKESCPKACEQFEALVREFERTRQQR